MKEHIIKIFILLIGIAAVAVACRPKAAAVIEPLKTSVVHADWTRNMVLYEINVRQFSEEGTFAGVDRALPQLMELGVNVLWFMPIYPIGEINRKGELGSYYSIKDYKGVNPEFGTIDEFKALVAKAHDLGFHVILDWVGNHSSWDNPLATEFPEWYEKDSVGSFVSPFDWTDVIQFDYTAMPLWDYMIGAMKYWVAEAGVDGYRCDFPGLVPEEFWFRATTELNTVRPVLMLAEDEDHSYLLERAFDMNYAWAHHHLMNAVAQGMRRPASLDSIMQYEIKRYDPDSYRLRFMTNHDENSWNGTIDEKMGDAQKALAAYLFTIPGVPLLYNGQEADLDKRLEFFTRDPIEWKDSDLRPFYTKLVHLRTTHPALRHGIEGGSYVVLKTDQKNVYAYKRIKDDSEVLVILNLSKNPVNVALKDGATAGTYNDLFSEAVVEIKQGNKMEMEPWGYMVLTK
ncbi:MAG: alpha-amylase family glycosyl hydrolase [Bacteroidales bacterium]|jgi:glycosidase|nr:alpha-amylase family glycosyl hydrolase [Bacteroidales bacterium]